MDWARSVTVSGFTGVGWCLCLGSNIRGLGCVFGITIALHKEETDDSSFSVLALSWVGLPHKTTF